jgi:hypothetical protein
MSNTNTAFNENIRKVWAEIARRQDFLSVGDMEVRHGLVRNSMCHLITEGKVTQYATFVKKFKQIEATAQEMERAGLYESFDLNRYDPFELLSFMYLPDTARKLKPALAKGKITAQRYSNLLTQARRAQTMMDRGISFVGRPGYKKKHTAPKDWTCKNPHCKAEQYYDKAKERYIRVWNPVLYSKKGEKPMCKLCRDEVRAGEKKRAEIVTEVLNTV